MQPSRAGGLQFPGNGDSHIYAHAHATVFNICSLLCCSARDLYRLNDNLGVRKSLMLGFCISACASTMIACARSMEFLLVVLFFVYPLGLSMGIPMLNVAIKRCD